MQRQGDDIGGQAIHNRLRLARRSTVGLLDRQFLPRLLCILRDELAIQILKQFARRIIGDVQQFARGIALNVLDYNQRHGNHDCHNGKRIEPQGFRESAVPGRASWWPGRLINFGKRPDVPKSRDIDTSFLGRQTCGSRRNLF